MLIRLLFFILPLLLVGCASPLFLVNKGISDYVIVIPPSAGKYETQAANELQQYLKKISGAALPVRKGEGSSTRHEIILSSAQGEVDPESLGQDGFYLKTVGEKLFIMGGTEKGSLYGVYYFLEKYIGCRLYASEALEVPQKETLELPEIDDLQVPQITYREVHYRDTWDSTYMAWHKLDRHRDVPDNEWGLWVHTYFSLLSPEEYYAAHPEYFAEINGKRMQTQLCLSNPQVLEIVCDNLGKLMDEQPQARYWSVSQMDNISYCTCERCRALDEQEGGPTGSVLRFANQVAERFPEKIISTLAYQYSRPAPRNLKPRENVNIMFCSIECNRSRPIATDSLSASFRKDMEDWAKLTDNIIVWDYVVQFENLLSPFPNLRVLQPNLQFFVENHAVAMFQQGNREIGGEWAELRGYLISKLLWDPYLDLDSVMNEFLMGYYGAASLPLRSYIDEMHDALQASGKNLEIFGGPLDHVEGYLSPEMLDGYQKLFDQAEAAVASDPLLLERVKVARLPLYYAMLEIGRTQEQGALAWFEDSAGTRTVKPEVRQRLEDFVALAEKQGVTRVKEWHTTPAEYGAAVRRLFEISFRENLASGKPVTYVIPHAEKYPADGPGSLTDGRRGSGDWRHFWQGWKGNDLEVVVDLEEETVCRKFTLTCLQELKDWIFLPEEVSFYVSLDGETYEEIGSDRFTLTPDGPGHIIKDFQIQHFGIRARFVKVKAKNIGTIPVWHGGAGAEAWLFADELGVE